MGGAQQMAAAGTEVPPAQTKHLIDLEIDLPISVKDFSTKVQQKPRRYPQIPDASRILTHINQSLDAAIVSRLARGLGYNVIKIKTQEEQLIEVHQKEEENPELLNPARRSSRSWGTSIMEKLRSWTVSANQRSPIPNMAGSPSISELTRVTSQRTHYFLDTPGHEAFTAMRARGVHITDIVVWSLPRMRDHASRKRPRPNARGERPRSSSP